MAVGDGGFKQVAFGFDKNEVNTYISDLRKKMKSMEEDMKANDKKTAEAEKLAEEADERIKAAEKEGKEKCEQLEKELSSQKDKVSSLESEIKKLKGEVEQERKKMSDMLRSGKGVNAEASKAYTEIIDKANADAKGIIDEANAKAAEITAAASQRNVEIGAKSADFLKVLKEQLDIITAGYNTVNLSAAEMLGEVPAVSVAAPVTAPVAAPAPKAEVEIAAAAVAVAAVEEAPVIAAEPEPVIEEAEEEIVTEIEASTEVMEVKSDSTDMPAITEEDKNAGDELASFDDVWGGSELAQTIYNNEKKDAVPLVNPDAKNLFGQDLFGTQDDSDDMSNTFEQPKDDEIVTEIKPLDVSDVADPAFDNSFDNDLLAQTMPSGSLGDVDEALLEAVKAAEEAFAVQPNNIADLDMDEHDEEPVGNSEDELMKALREAEAALNNLAPADMGDDSTDTTVSDSSADSSAGDPWADLQKQFEAMEQSGNFGADESTYQQEEKPAEPATPSADDSAIWDFGSASSDSDSDDDMSSDMFGGFGGF
ncbi:MAG: hypothetical protein E7485_04200 [Ruminococcaceae bacterium]|nr:hypothetical protein [Oscillospiraceae bacterium]